VYSCLNESGMSRIFDLWGEITAQYAINPAYANPVVEVVVDDYTNQYGTTYRLAYSVIDWIGDDGATLLSRVATLEATQETLPV
jgi:hypothetical protein